MRPKLLLALIVPLIVASVPFQAVEVPPARMLRVSLLEGDVTYQRTDLDRWVDLSINTPIFEGDKVWVGRGGRAEVEFENGGFARLSENTILEFSRLSDVSSRNGVEVRLIQGLASFQTRAEPAFTIQTPLFSAQLADAASFRVEVDTDGSGRLVVFDGKLEVSGQGSRLFVRNGELVRFLSQDANRYYLETNYVKDEWDRWNEERNDYLTKITQEQFHNGDRGWTTADLYNYGSWYDVPTYGRIWRPAAVGVDWVPFRSGRWCWYSTFGWTWISYEPWGWIPYHYGRWAHVNPYGWSWVPGPRYVSWCPGAVNWVQGTQWVGWVPLGTARAMVWLRSWWRERLRVEKLPSSRFGYLSSPRQFCQRYTFSWIPLSARPLRGWKNHRRTTPHQPDSGQPDAGGRKPNATCLHQRRSRSTAQHAGANRQCWKKFRIAEFAVGNGSNAAGKEPFGQRSCLGFHKRRHPTNCSWRPNDPNHLHARTNSTRPVIRQLEQRRQHRPIRAAPADLSNGRSRITLRRTVCTATVSVYMGPSHGTCAPSARRSCGRSFNQPRRPIFPSACV